MSSLLAAIATLGAVIALGLLPPPSRPADRVTWVRRGIVALLLLLPLLHAWGILRTSKDRLDGVVFDYVGKQLAFDREHPLVAGGSPAAADQVEDLNATRLTPRTLTLSPLDDEPETTDGDPSRAALVRLAPPTPAISIDGSFLNSVPLENGDQIVVARGASEPVFLTYTRGRITREGREVVLQGRLSRFFSGSTRVYELQGLGENLGVDLPGIYSFLMRPKASSPWHLVLRTDDVHVERDGTTAARFVAEHTVPAAFVLDLQIVLNGALRSQRRDEIVIHEDRIEVRFDDPRTWAVALDPAMAETRLAITVPSSFARTEMVELPEHSPRFRGLVAEFDYRRETDTATLRYAGDEQAVEPGTIYALGTGADRLLVRLDRHRFPKQLLFDLAMMALFFAVFLGPGMTAHAGLAAVIAPVGQLLGFRLLFSYKAATRPPGFTLEPFQEARLALWLVPTAILFAWTAAWLLRRKASPSEQLSTTVGRLAWPLGGLLVAAAGCWVVSAGAGTERRALVAVPILLAAALLALAVLTARGGHRGGWLMRWRRDGLPFSSVWLLGFGAALLVVRAFAAQIGMPETLRLPLINFRLLWTVVHLPIAALLAGLALHALSRPARDTEGRPMLRSWLTGFFALLLFLALVFPGIALAVDDLGLLLAHSLAPIFGLLMLGGTLYRWPALPTGARLALLVLPLVPLLVVIGVNAYPEALIGLVGWGEDGAEGEGTSWDTAAKLGSSRAQQMFRLFMLANPESLQDQGLIASERVAIHYATLQSYADEGSTWGAGYLSSPLPRHLGITYLSDLVPMVFVLPDFGKMGLVALALLYLAMVAGVWSTSRQVDDDDPLGGQGLTIALVALFAVALPSLYMMLANLNLVLFTGKNMNLLSLNSISDVLQSGSLLALAVLALGLRKGVT